MFTFEYKLRIDICSWIAGNLRESCRSFSQQHVILFHKSVLPFKSQGLLLRTFVLVEGHLVPIDNWQVYVLLFNEKTSDLPHIFKIVWKTFP